ncbi:MAG: hypothetical protein S4CHLAM81_04180 [Chlamydiales bacterium]|nr:hypothetical protein [Chlamydiales bacterium]MCH9635207.1 hypothetical protein [Chlamydiales bacterium]MCH9703184.1 membrane dipeptidase [Chlamydiota bacterium]
MRVADLHCDLLAFLGGGGDLMDSKARCSLPQLQAGSVAFQAMAIYTESKRGSVQSAKRQIEAYRQLLTHDAFVPFEGAFCEGKIAIAPAIENLSGLLEEDEPLERLFERFFPVFYVSLTWNSENRFGGGNESSAGLKRDGELFLEFLSQKKVAIDLSHTSDYLASDIFEFIDKKGLEITPIASHSNLRAVWNQARNLPDEFACEIIKRGGVIGFNLVRKFVGEKPPRGFVDHLEHLAHLGGSGHHCLGADFFFEGDVIPALHHLLPFYYTGYGEASCYKKLLAPLDEERQRAIAHANFEAFVKRGKIGLFSG